MTESQIERDIVQYLRKRGYLVIPTHGPRNKPVCPGLPDLLVYDPYVRYGLYPPFWIEVKTPTGKVSPIQAEMHAFLTERGARVIVAHSVEEVMDI